MEEAISSGKADLIGGGRLFFVDPEYYKKAKEGRGEDVLPCVRCNKCHVPSMEGEWLSICTVNPEMGLRHKIDKMISPSSSQRKVAVIGGGPSGMRSAIYASDRGHQVTIFEKEERLGGQINLMDDMKFKWPIVNYREYLIRQVEKRNIKVILNKKVSPDEIKNQGFDTVIAALGALPKKPPIEGADKAYDSFSVLGHESELGKRCVVIGGSETGTEIAMYLAEAGHIVTVLTRQNDLALDATPIHYREMMQEYYYGLDSFDFITGASATGIRDGVVEYRDLEGNIKSIECDDVVALGGMYSLQDEAISFYDAADDFYMVGDCRNVGNIHKANRDAFSVTHQF